MDDTKRYTIALPPGRDDYNLLATLEAAQEELIKLLRERQTIESRIATLQSDIVHLAALCRVEIDDPIAQLGLTDAIRWIISKETGPAVAVLGPQGEPTVKKSIGIKQIVEELKRYPDVSEYKNITANVHTIIKRLVKANEVKPVASASNSLGGSEYTWTGPFFVIPPSVGWVKERMKKE